MNRPSPPDVSSPQALRDLAWTLESPFLVSPPTVSPFAESLLQIQDHLTAFTPQLVQFLNERKTFRVGRYFENLVHFYLRYVVGCEFAGQGMQVQDAGQPTVGELDFVFYDLQRRLQHWETAIKFFLYLPEVDDGESQFRGPNPRDCLESKVDRLVHHQLPLSGRVFSDVKIRVPFVKGRVFYPQTGGTAVVPPELAGGYRLSPGHLRGLWVRYRDAECYAEEFCASGSRCFLLTKPFWLADPPFDSVSGQCGVKPLSTRTPGEFLDALNRHGYSGRRCVQLSIHVSEGRERQDSTRVIIVPDRWPDLP